MPSPVLILKNACLCTIMVPNYSFITWLVPSGTALGQGGKHHQVCEGCVPAGMSGVLIGPARI